MMISDNNELTVFLNYVCKQQWPSYPGYYLRYSLKGVLNFIFQNPFHPSSMKWLVKQYFDMTG